MPDSLRYWEIAGTWLSGAGSLAAAGIALWLGLRSDRARLAVSFGVERSYNVDLHKQIETSIIVTLASVGARPIWVTSIQWSHGEHVQMLWPYDADQERPDQIFNKRLDHGEPVNFYFAVGDNLPELKRLIPDTKSLRKLECVVHTTTRKPKCVVVPQVARDALVQRLEANQED